MQVPWPAPLRQPLREQPALQQVPRASGLLLPLVLCLLSFWLLQQLRLVALLQLPPCCPESALSIVSRVQSVPSLFARSRPAHPLCAGSPTLATWPRGLAEAVCGACDASASPQGTTGCGCEGGARTRDPLQQHPLVSWLPCCGQVTSMRMHRRPSASVTPCFWPRLGLCPFRGLRSCPEVGRVRQGKVRSSRLCCRGWRGPSATRSCRQGWTPPRPCCWPARGVVCRHWCLAGGGHHQFFNFVLFEILFASRQLFGFA